MAKTPQHNKKRTSQSKIGVKEPVPDYIAEIKFWEAMINEERATALGNRMIHYAKTNPSAITFTKFYEIEKIYESAVRRWRKQFPDFDTSFKFVKDIFAERRAHLAREMDNKFISSEMHLYSCMHEDYKALEHERKKELKIAGEKKVDMDLIQAVIDKTMGPKTKKQKEEYEQRIRNETEDNV